MNSLPEKFNDEFIMGREDSKIIDYVRDIFMSLELHPEIHAWMCMAGVRQQAETLLSGHIGAVLASFGILNQPINRFA